MHLDLFEVGLEIGHLFFELTAVAGQHIEEFAQLRPGVARAVGRVDRQEL